MLGEKPLHELNRKLKGSEKETGRQAHCDIKHPGSIGGGLGDSGLVAGRGVWCIISFL